jgi:hypothetical protein
MIEGYVVYVTEAFHSQLNLLVYPISPTFFFAMASTKKSPTRQKNKNEKKKKKKSYDKNDVPNFAKHILQKHKNFEKKNIYLFC